MPWQSEYAEANGLRFHYTRTGGDRPPVVMAHGVTDDGGCWTPIAREIERDYDIVMIDARGHGRSSVTESGYDVVSQAEDLRAIISELGLHRPAVVGHSMGAMTALMLAGTAPDVPSGIFLEDPPPWWGFQPDETRARGTDMLATITRVKARTRVERIAAKRDEAPAWSVAELEAWADAKERCSLNVLDVYRPEAYPDLDWAATLRNISCPALLVTADTKLGGLLDQTGVDTLRGWIPALEVAHVPGAGHSIRRDQPERYLEILERFLVSITNARD